MLGLRHSWLSREIVAFGVFAALASAVCGRRASLTHIASRSRLHAASVARWIDWLGWSVAATGAIAVFCSAMIYVFTQRECWSFAARRRAIRADQRAAGRRGDVAEHSGVDDRGSPSPSYSTLVARMRPDALPDADRRSRRRSWLGKRAIFRHLLLRRMTPLTTLGAAADAATCRTSTLARFALGVLGGVVMPAMLARRNAATLSSGPDWCSSS